jgi:hypothetical protein
MSMNIGKATTFASKVLANGGISIDHKGHELSGSNGFAVSIYPERECKVPANEFTADDIVRFASTNHDLLSRCNAVLGIWLDDGLVYLDVSLVIASQESALSLARENHQLAIFSFETGASIFA